MRRESETIIELLGFGKNGHNLNVIFFKSEVKCVVCGCVWKLDCDVHRTVSFVLCIQYSIKIE